jgi:hypothetical protein
MNLLRTVRSLHWVLEPVNDSFTSFALMTVVDGTIPKSYKEAAESKDREKWMEAMKSEINSIRDNKVGELVKLPTGRRPIQSKWVYALKKNSNGEIIRFKARLVAMGFRQKYGVDYNHTFSPVVRFDIFRLLCSLAARYDWEIHQIDVDTAFLNGVLEEDIYLSQPEGFEDKEKPHLVIKLKKALYGLKQAGRVWNQRLDTTLRGMKFNPLESDCKMH